VRTILQAAGLPLLPPSEMSSERFLELMAVDKKVIDGNLRLVLLQQLGKAVVTSDFPAERLLETLAAGERLGQL
jgi:3-dehydroquinate synthase